MPPDPDPRPQPVPARPPLAEFEQWLRAHPDNFAKWTRHKDVTKSKTINLGLVSGSRVWMRVRAVNAAGEGPWSDPATKIVP